MFKFYSFSAEYLGVMTKLKTTLWYLLLIPFFLLGCTRDLDMGVLNAPSFSQDNSYQLSEDGTYTITLPYRSIIEDHLEIENADSYSVINGTLTITPIFKETVTVKHLGVTIAVIPYPKPLVISNNGTSLFSIYFSGNVNAIVEYTNDSNALVTKPVKSNTNSLITATTLRSSTNPGGGGLSALKTDLPNIILKNLGSNKISIYGSYQGIHFADTARDIEQWGDHSPESLTGLFYGNTSITSFYSINSPNLNKTKDLSYMFVGATNFNSNIEHWDVSNIKEMEAIFNGASSFNQPLNNWDVSNLENLKYAFSSAKAFHQPLDKWNTANVKNMAYTFQDAWKFNQDINNWNTSKVQDMTGLFNGAKAFNQPLNNWDVRNVLNMSSMFRDASAFNLPINFNSEKVTDLHHMFADTYIFNSEVSMNTQKVTNMSYMFANAKGFNKTLTFNTENVTTMEGMFADAKNYNNNDQALDLNTSRVLNMSSMFSGASMFNQEVLFDTSSVNNMKKMFYYASAFDKPLDFNTSNVTNMNSMFKYAGKYNQDITRWNVDNVIDCMYFYSSSALTEALLPSLSHCERQPP